jgi:hypothetical protein
MMGKKKRARKLAEKAKRKAREAFNMAPPQPAPVVPDLTSEDPVIEGIRANKVIHKHTRELVASAMQRNKLSGWYETNENPRKPDAQIAVEVLRQFTVIAQALAERDPKPQITHEVVLLAAQTVGWVQGLTHQTHVKAWA